MNDLWSADERDQIEHEVGDDLWRVMMRHALSIPALSALLANLSGLPAQQIAELQALHLLLDPRIEQFVHRALPHLLRRLDPDAVAERTELRGQIGGNVQWGATTAARARSGGADRALFVCALPQRRIIAPQARLLVQLIALFDAALRRLQPWLEQPLHEGWTASVTQTAMLLKRAREHPTLRTLRPEPRSYASDLAACLRSPYQDIVLLARAVRAAQQLQERAGVLEAMRQRVLRPLDDDRLYEVWVLLGAARAFSDLGWQLDQSGLIGRVRSPFTYRAPGGRGLARLRFGHTPAHWRGVSRYREIFQRYGLGGAVRRPDLIIELQQGRQRTHLLVEVKRTRDAQYSADSLYKVLGYLADFAPIFKEQQGTLALLVLWEVPGSVIAPPHLPSAVAVATYQTYRETLAHTVQLSLVESGAIPNPGEQCV